MEDPRFHWHVALFDYELFYSTCNFVYYINNVNEWLENKVLYN